MAPDTTTHVPALASDNLSDKFDPSQLTDRARKILWRNRPRHPVSAATIVKTFYDSKGYGYFLFSNGMITKTPA